MAVNAIQNSSLNDFGPPVANLDMNGYRLIDIADPLDDTDAVPKKYVDGQIQSIQTSLADVTSALAAINGGSIGSLDAPARDAIGWPYTGT